MKLIQGGFKYYIVVLLIIASIWSSCTSNKQESKVEAVETPIYVPAFNADSAYRYVKEQVDFGPRVPNTKAHIETGDYLVNKLKGFNWNVEEQNFKSITFDGAELYLRNIIASFNTTAKKRILLTAHWDTRPFADKDNERPLEPILGANDGASGVGVLLEIARVISTYDSLTIGVDIILFDGEDWGEKMYEDRVSPPVDKESWWALGSQYWSKNKHNPNYSAFYGILLDMVGAKNSVFYIENYSNYYAPSIVNKVWSQAKALGYGRYFVKQSGGQVMDDHYFVNEYAKIPMIDIIPTDPIDGGFGDYHHTHDDNMDVISKETLKAVGETVINVVYREK